MILRYIILLTLERAQVGFKSGRAGEANFCDAVLVRGDGPNFSFVCATFNKVCSGIEIWVCPCSKG